ARAFVRVIDESRHVVAESPGMSSRLAIDAFPPPGASPSAPGPIVSLTGTQGKAHRAVSSLAKVGGDPGRLATIQVALNIEAARDLVMGYRKTLLLVLGAGLASCGLAGYWLARMGLRPLRQIA